LGSAALLVEPRAASPETIETLLVASDGSERTEQSLRDQVATLDPAAEVVTEEVLFEQRTSRREFERALLEIGVVFALVVGLAAQFIAGLDAIWERRRQMAILLATGISPGVLRRSQVVFLLIPLIVACLLGGGVGAMTDAALDRGARTPLGIADVLLVGLLAVVGASALFAVLIAKWGVSAKWLGSAMRTE
jgi:hypothetical protein